MLTFPDGSIYDLRVGQPPSNLPDIPARNGPFYNVPVGWIPKPGEIKVFVAHDDPTKPYRAEGAPSNRFYTNETRNKIFDYDEDTDTVYFNRFMGVKLEYHRDWLKDFEARNNYNLLDWWVDKGAGWCDSDAAQTDPYVDYVHYNVIDCGGNRRKGIKKIKDSKGREFVIVEMVPVVGSPPSYTYESHPQYIQKQLCVTNQITWRTPDQGDVTWLNMSPKRYLAYWVYDGTEDLVLCRFYPDEPFDATLYGRKVTVTQYCFQGSTTFVNVVGELQGWYIADESPPAPESCYPYASLSWRDARQYIEHPKWPGPPSQNCGWKKP